VNFLFRPFLRLSGQRSLADPDWRGQHDPTGTGMGTNHEPKSSQTRTACDMTRWTHVPALQRIPAESVRNLQEVRGYFDPELRREDLL
jgi:hypothetical protein